MKTAPLIPKWREHRQERGWTLKEAAERLGNVGFPGLSHIERGRHFASPQVLARACEVYGCGVGDLYELRP